MSTTQCNECDAILREFRDARAEMPPVLRDRYWAERNAFLKIIGGTEEDVERAENVAGNFPFPAQSGLHLPEGRYPKIQTIFCRALVHRFRSGHTILWILFTK